MNKRDAINHIRQFGGRLDRFRKSVGGSGDGGRNAPKRAKSSPKPASISLFSRRTSTNGSSTTRFPRAILLRKKPVSSAMP